MVRKIRAHRRSAVGKPCNGMGTQRECNVQHHRTQKERSVHPALQSKGKNVIFRHVFVKHYERRGSAAGTQGTTLQNAEATQGVHDTTLWAQMERSRNAGRNADGTQGSNTSNHKNTTFGNGTQQERRAHSCYMMR